VNSALIFAPAATFLAFVALAAGLYWRAAEQQSAIRTRMAIFAPALSGPGGTTLSGSPLVGQRRFSSIPSLQRFLQRRNSGERLTADLERAGVSMRAGEYVLVRVSAALLAGALALVAQVAWPLAVVVGAVASLLPLLYIRWRQQRRGVQFDSQLVDALVLISNALKSGFSFLQAMQAVAEEMDDPIGVEFRRALSESRMGGAVDEAMLAIAHRVQSKDFELVVTGMAIQRQVGGNLTEIIGNVVHTVRERHRLYREIRTLTGEMRMSAWVLGLLPAALAVVMTVMNPGYLSSMWTSFGGRLLLGLAVLLDGVGFLFFRKLMNIEV
jgi:tight adherence protein B